MSDPRRVVGDVSLPSKRLVTEENGGPTLGLCDIETKSRCTLLPLTAPVTTNVPQGPASPHQFPLPEMVDPLSVRVISQKFPGMDISWAHFPARFSGATGSEQALATRAINNADISERMDTSNEKL
ncbi:MAG: hypothetical protein ACJ8AA_10895 [Gemmatimonadaceae bacterium]